MATITMLGLYNYDPTIFDLMTLPAGIDKDLVRDNILLQSAEFEALYPNPVFVKQAVKRWADKWYFTFEKWVKALAIEYDPLNNYDRYEEYEDTGKETRADSGSSSSNSSTNSSTSGSTTSGGTTQHDISAYDSATMREDTKDTSSASGTDSTTGSTTGNTSASESSNGTTDTSLKHKAHLYGNIGVTTSQQMLEAELQVARFNLVDQITDCFMNEFCIRVY